MAYTSRDIDIIEGLGPIRRRPTMYVGEPSPNQTLCGRLIECVLANVAAKRPPPTAVRFILWANDAVTVAFDGEPLPIHPFRAPGGISHPELYQMFMCLTDPGSPLNLGAVIVNALSE